MQDEKDASETDAGEAPAARRDHPSSGTSALHAERRRLEALGAARRTPSKLAQLSLAGLLVVGVCSAAVAACAVWQLGAIVARLIDYVEPAASPVRLTSGEAARPRQATASPAAATAGALPSRGSETRPASAAAPVAIETSVMGSGVRRALSFEEGAEAPEKITPVGLDATLEDAAPELVIGREPPASFPRTRACEEIFVYIVSLVEGAPRDSAASLAVGSAGPGRFRSPGERIGDWTVVAIRDDWSGLNPVVWLEKDGAVCRAELAGNPARVEVYQPPKPKPKRRKPRRRRGRR